MEYSERLTRLERFYEEGRLVRNDWGDGEECACLLAALFPETSDPEFRGNRCAAVPRDVMPPWAAPMVMELADHAESSSWPRTQQRFVRVARALPRLDDAHWWRARKRFLANALEAAGRAVLRRDEPEYLAVLTDVANVLRGDPTYMPRALLEQRVGALRVTFDGVRASAVVRLMGLVRDAYRDPARATHVYVTSGVPLPELGECFLSALEEQCALAA